MPSGTATAAQVTTAFSTVPNKASQPAAVGQRVDLQTLLVSSSFASVFLVYHNPPSVVMPLLAATSRAMRDVVAEAVDFLFNEATAAKTQLLFNLLFSNVESLL